jgi:predicted ATP-grasp superfamily ATP-dependent carboligase
MRERLLIIGASARAAAASALRAGFSPSAIDLFCDRDLAASPRLRIAAADYPEGLPRIAARLPPAPFIYTGALESHPEVLARLARRRPLWGNPPSVLARARDPFLLRSVLLQAGLPAPEVRPGRRPPPRGGRWVEKPFQGGGGRGIRFSSSRRPAAARSGFYQEWIPGTPCSAVYVATGGRAELLGLTRQLVGERGLGAGPFAYCGSIGPLPLGPRGEDQLRRLGTALVRAFALAGLFGVDLVARAGRFWAIELNPRYTASVEVLERTLSLHALRLHAGAFSAHPGRAEKPGGPRPASPEARPGGLLGKAVLFARHDLVVPAGIGEGEVWADLPYPGERIQAGRPILTLFARGRTVYGCRKELLRRARSVERFMTVSGGEPLSITTAVRR